MCFALYQIYTFDIVSIVFVVSALGGTKHFESESRTKLCCEKPFGIK